MKKGFTLLELVITIIIIGILASLSIPKLMDIVEESYSAEAFIFLSPLRKAQEIHYLMNGKYDVQVKNLTDIGLKSDGSHSAKLSQYWFFATTRAVGYFEETLEGGGPTNYQGFTLSAWRKDKNGNLGNPQYHLHESGAISKTEVFPGDPDDDIEHLHGDYRHSHFIPDDV